MIFIQNFSKLSFFNWLWVKIIFEAMRTYLKKNFLNFCNKIMFGVKSLTNITYEGLRFWYCKSFVVFFWREINQSPVLKKSMNSHDWTYVSKKVFPTMGWGKIFFSVFPPHKNHWVSVKHVKICIFYCKGENFFVHLRSKILREIFFLNFMNFVLFEPRRNCRNCYVRGRLYYCAWSQATWIANSFDVLTGHLYEISWC